MCKTGLAKIGDKEMTSKHTSAAFYVTYTNKRSTCNASYAL